MIAKIEQVYDARTRPTWEFRFAMTTLEPITFLNICFALLILLLGMRILKTMRFSLLRNSVQLFIAASILLAAKEVLVLVPQGARGPWLARVPDFLETVFIACLCAAMYLIVQSERLEISQLHDQVGKDALTGLMNLTAFSKIATARIKMAQQNGQPLALFMLDLDAFKQYNDSFGHEAGNVALKTVASVLRQTARDTDLVARYGGEEFILLLATGPETALPAAERFRTTIASKCSPESEPALFRALTASIGVSRLAPTLHGLQELIEAADRQLYEAKRNGRNQVAIEC